MFRQCKFYLWKVAALTSLICLLSVDAHALLSCRNLFDISETDQSTELNNLESPEIEAKLLIPNKVAAKAIKKLEGQIITVALPDGKRLKFNIEFNMEHIYEDVYYDVPKNDRLALFDVGGLLRMRTRFDRKKGERKYALRYAGFQAKDASRTDASLTDAVFARNEFRGKRFSSIEKFNGSKVLRLRGQESDRAVRYARQLIGSEGDFSEMLRVTQRRFFLKMSSVESHVPAIYLSVDNVDFTSPLAKTPTASALVAELEIIDDLRFASQRDRQFKVAVLNSVSSYFRDRFTLVPAEEDKYAMGIRALKEAGANH